MIDLDLKIQDKEVTRALDAFAKKSGVPVNFVVRDQMRLWLQDLIRLGPPKKRGSKGKSLSRPAGRSAVAYDLNLIFAPAVRVGQAQERFWQGAPYVVPATTTDAKFLVPQADWQPSMGSGAMKRYHEGWQARKSGRVRRKEKNTVEDRGGLTVVKKKHVKRKEFMAYRKQVQARVGRLAASWLPALHDVARRTNTRGIYPKWLDKAQGASGSVTSTLTALGRGYVEATNDMNYAEYKLRGLLGPTRAKRAKDMREQMQKRMRKLQRQFNNKELRRVA